MNRTMKIPYVVDSYFITLQGEMFFAWDVDREKFQRDIKSFYEEMKNCESTGNYHSRPVCIVTGLKTYENQSFHMNFNETVDENGRPRIVAYINDCSGALLDGKAHEYQPLTWDEAKKWCEEIIELPV
ncbi:hypothetical protein CN918_31285 [Priestia megaterium]|nr:hypothetical protein CN918_31285 [Priestia megaterium]